MAANISSVILGIERTDGVEVNKLPSQLDGVIEYFRSGWSAWQLLFTMLLLLATYDQGKFRRQNSDIRILTKTICKPCTLSRRDRSPGLSSRYRSWVLFYKHYIPSLILI
jgi:hypothetical protein